MGYIKQALAGAAVAYGIQYITKKRADGSSILSDFVNSPSDFVDKAKNYATEQAGKAKDYATEQAEKAKDFANSVTEQVKESVTQ